MSSSNYYAALGIKNFSSRLEVKKAFRKLAVKIHPDKPTGDETRFKLIMKAKEELSSPTKKRKYDAALKLRTASAASKYAPINLSPSPPPKPPRPPGPSKRDLLHQSYLKQQRERKTKRVPWWKRGATPKVDNCKLPEPGTTESTSKPEGGWEQDAEGKWKYIGGGKTYNKRVRRQHKRIDQRLAKVDAAAKAKMDAADRMDLLDALAGTEKGEEKYSDKGWVEDANGKWRWGYSEQTRKRNAANDKRRARRNKFHYEMHQLRKKQKIEEFKDSFPTQQPSEISLRNYSKSSSRQPKSSSQSERKYNGSILGKPNQYSKKSSDDNKSNSKKSSSDSKLNSSNGQKPDSNEAIVNRLRAKLNKFIKKKDNYIKDKIIRRF